MSPPRRARYGARDNMHALLEWEGDPNLLPTELLGLTDKPPGTYGPGDCWWPSVGCAPLGGWWALWWTLPDEESQRGGMAYSNVALWPLDEVVLVEDLRPVMTLLGGPDSIPQPPVEMLELVAEALLSQDPGPSIVQDLNTWPSILAALWERLWPSTRCTFSARVAVSPPQGGDSVSPPWLFCIPRERSLQWSEHRLISSTVPIPDPPVRSRATKWLIGGRDAVLEEVLKACGPLPGELKFLTRIARAADGLERYRTTPTAEHALRLLRTLVAIAPQPGKASLLKTEVLDGLERGLASAQPSLALALANLDPATLPEARPLEEALGRWASQKIAGLPIQESSKLLERLNGERAQAWWQRAVRGAIAKGLAEPNPHWASAALGWLVSDPSPVVLEDLLAHSESVEQRLLAAADTADLDESAAGRLRSHTVMRGWSRLHAWAAMRSLRAKEALRAQRDFPTQPSAGLGFLVDRLPGAAVVEEAISRPDDKFLKLVAQRTTREPGLLDPLDVHQAGWRALWSEHLAHNGRTWPPGANQKQLGMGLLDEVLSGDPAEGIVVPLANDLAEIAYSHPRRAELWGALGARGRASLLALVAEVLARLCATGTSITPPELPLAEAIVIRAKVTPPSAKLLARLLHWNVYVDEQDALRWLQRLERSEWPPIAQTIGQAVLARKWKRTAEELYRELRWKTELRPAVEACLDLLSEWERHFFRWTFGHTTPNEKNDSILVRRVAELGATLSPEGLDGLWERAGGERKWLPYYGTPNSRWHEAAKLAHKGALRDGLQSLVRELEEEFPHNTDVKELVKAIEKAKNKK